MSKIGKLPIPIENNVNVEINLPQVVIKGPKGMLTYDLPAEILVSESENELQVKPLRDGKKTQALWGLWRSLLANAVEGVSKGFSKELEIVGVGYRAQKKGNGLELEVGLSHKVDFEPPEGVSVDLEKSVIKVTGIDKALVGQVAANIRSVRPPEPYKGKGIRYVGEYVRIKPGKSAKTGA